MLLATLAGAGIAHAQEAPETKASADSQALEEIVVTGSRIRRAATDSSAPVSIINPQDLTDRGFISAGQALNDVTAITPVYPEASGSGTASGTGQTYPNLFNLGPGRTLTLVDGRRFVSSATPVTGTAGGSGSAVDTNLIPVGLLQRIDVVEAGGAAVYGSDAIAGVVNYVLKRNFTGVEADAQAGITDRGDYPTYNVRGTFGSNFGGGKGNVAFEGEFSQTQPLSFADRPLSALSRTTSGTTQILNSRFYEFNPNGVIFSVPAPTPACGGANCFTRLSGTPVQFSTDGQSVVPFNPGLNPLTGSSLLTPPFATGGDGYSYSNLAALYTGVKRYSGNILAHYDFSDHLKLSGSFLYGHTTGTDESGSQGYSRTILNSVASGAGYITFTKANPYLSAADIATLTTASPSFGAGAPLFLSKIFTDITPTKAFITDTDSYRGLIALDGDFNAFKRNFYYSLSYSRSEVDSSQTGYDVYQSRFTNAINSTKNAAGQIVCAINAVNVVDAACSPINPFGTGVISAAARAYVSVPVGYHYSNTEDDVLGTIGGDVISLPAGAVKFSAAYEHRSESANYEPSAAQQQGLVGSLVPSPSTSGSYDTNEYSGELLVPIFGKGFTLPGVKSLEVNAQYRRVDNSVAGSEDIYGAGLRWEIVDGFSLRASQSRNFRAPTLYQLFAPTSTALAGGVLDPCDSRIVNAGAAPATRYANCLALFTANPNYGTGSAGTAPVGSSAATRLATFQDTAYNFSTALVTSGGDPKLQNEVSDTTTFGFVFQPRWVPGQLTVVVDHIDVSLANGITAFTPTNFTQSCFDATGASGATCSFFTRDAVGNIATAVSTTYNAASVKYHGETANISYRFPLRWLSRREGWGDLELAADATHNEMLRTEVQGAVTEIVGTVAEPRWQARFDVRYIRGPLRLTYEAYYLPDVLAVQGANATNNAYPNVKANLRQSVSALYDFGKFQLRAGIDDITDRMTSYPSLAYGDILGRRFFLGVKAKY